MAQPYTFDPPQAFQSACRASAGTLSVLSPSIIIKILTFIDPLDPVEHSTISVFPVLFNDDEQHFFGDSESSSQVYGIYKSSSTSRVFNLLIKNSPQLWRWLWITVGRFRQKYKALKIIRRFSRRSHYTLEAIKMDLNPFSEKEEALESYLGIMEELSKSKESLKILWIGSPGINPVWLTKARELIETCPNLKSSGLLSPPAPSETSWPTPNLSLWSIKRSLDLSPQRLTHFYYINHHSLFEFSDILIEILGGVKFVEIVTPTESPCPVSWIQRLLETSRQSLKHCSLESVVMDFVPYASPDEVIQLPELEYLHVNCLLRLGVEKPHVVLEKDLSPLFSKLKCPSLTVLSLGNMTSSSAFSLKAPDVIAFRLNVANPTRESMKDLPVLISTSNWPRLHWLVLVDDNLEMYHLSDVLQRLSRDAKELERLIIQVDNPSPLHQDLKIMLVARQLNDSRGLHPIEFLSLGSELTRSIDEGDLEWLKAEVGTIKIGAGRFARYESRSFHNRKVPDRSSVRS